MALSTKFPIRCRSGYGHICHRVASCLFHYEFEFIHPFSDGNGRMGRLWQTLILSRWRPALAFLPVESVVKDNQSAYYAALRAADQQSDATPFVRFMLQALSAALAQALTSTPAGSEKSSEKGSEKIPDRICSLLQRNPRASAKALAADLGISDRAVEKHLAKLKAEGRLKRVGPAKGGYWEVL